MGNGAESPFGPGPIDEADVPAADPAVDALQAMSDAEAEEKLAAGLKAVEEKRKMEGAKAALKALGEFIRPFIPIP